MASATQRRGPIELGPINPDEIYPVECLMGRAGVGHKTINKLRREYGMEVFRAGRRVYVLGASFRDAVIRSGKKHN